MFRERTLPSSISVSTSFNSAGVENRVENGSGDKETPPLPSPKGIVFPTRVDIVGYFNPQFEA